jgi:hypothetical protein
MEPDARIADILPTLKDPVEYVRGVVGSFFSYTFDKGKAIIRIGVSGKGTFPNYCIEQHRDPISTTLEVGEATVEFTTTFEHRHCYRGRNHKEILDDSFIGEKWSSASMSFAEVQTLLGKLRGKK